MRATCVIALSAASCPTVDDPGADFGRWLKECYGVSYTHPERGYSRLARQVRESLQRGRSVVLVVVDALASHLVREAVGYLKDYLREDPTWSSYLLTALPTITDVCKEAVLTGWRPDQCTGGLVPLLCRAYDLTEDQVQVAASWQEGERLQVNARTRLVVHRDNQLDDQVHRPSPYHVLLDESASVFRRLAELVSRWVGDFTCLNQSPPVVLVTADHGFTYGPALGSETRGQQRLDGRHRCVEVAGQTCRPRSGGRFVSISRQGTALTGQELLGRSRPTFWTRYCFWLGHVSRRSGGGPRCQDHGLGEIRERGLAACETPHRSRRAAEVAAPLWVQEKLSSCGARSNHGSAGRPRKSVGRGTR